MLTWPRNWTTREIISWLYHDTLRICLFVYTMEDYLPTEKHAVSKTRLEMHFLSLPSFWQGILCTFLRTHYCASSEMSQWRTSQYNYDCPKYLEGHCHILELITKIWETETNANRQVETGLTRRVTHSLSPLLPTSHFRKTWYIHFSVLYLSVDKDFMIC